MRAKYIPCLILNGLIFLLLGVLIWHTGKMMVVGKQMEGYLREKYGKEFVVTKVHYVYPYLGGSLEIEGLAYAKDDPDLKFEIAKSASDNNANTKAYSESYNRDLWEKQKRDEIKQILNTELVWVEISAFYEQKEFYGRTISIFEAEEKFKDQMVICISNVLFINPRIYKKEFSHYLNLIHGKLSGERMNYLFSLIKKLRDNNYKDVTLILSYYNEDSRVKVEKEIMDYFRDGRYKLYVSEEDLLCRISIRDINNITKLEDIGSHINTEVADGYINEEILSKYRD